MKRAVFVLGTLDYEAVKRGRMLLDATVDLIDEAAKLAELDPSLVIVMEDPLFASKAKGKITQTKIKAQRARVLAEIADARPDVVVCLGPVASACVFGKGNLVEGELLRRAHFPLPDAPDTPVYVTFSMENIRFKAGLAAWLMRDVYAAAHGYSEPQWGEYTTVKPGDAAWDELPEYLREVPDAVGFDLETYPGLDPWHPQARIRMAVISWRPHQALVVQAGPNSELPQWLTDVMANPLTVKAGSNIKFDYRWCRRFGMDLQNLHDTSVAEHIIDESNPKKDLKSLTFIYAPHLGDYSRAHRDLVRQRGGWEFVADDEQYQYCGGDGEASLAAYRGQMARIHADNLWQPYCLMKDLYPVIARMEEVGACLDVRVNRELAELYEQRLAILRQQALEVLGPININSPTQLAKALKTLVPDINLRLRDWVRAVGDEETEEADTSRSVLEREAWRHPVIPVVLEFRKYRTRYSTFIKGVYDKHMVEHGGKHYVHAEYRGDVVETYRLSSRNPNDMNAPRKESCSACKDADEPCASCKQLTIKRQVVSRFEGGQILEIDQSQIEIRIAAWLSNDTKMLAAIASGGDVHQQMAAIMLDKPAADVVKQERQECKARTFLILYGGGARKLARDLKTGIDRAQRLINDYFATFTGLRHHIKTTHAEVQRDGKIATMWGFVRRFVWPSHWDSPDGWRIFRQAYNSKIQNGAVGVSYCAMIWLDEQLRHRKAKSVLFKHIHDSMVIDVHPDELEWVPNLAFVAMTGGARTVAERYGVNLDTLPLHAEAVMGYNWGEGQKISAEQAEQGEFDGY